MLRTGGWRGQAPQREPGRPPEQQTSPLTSPQQGAFARRIADLTLRLLVAAWHRVVWSQNNLPRYARPCWERRHETRIALCRLTWRAFKGHHQEVSAVLQYPLCSGEGALLLPAPVDLEPPGEG